MPQPGRYSVAAAVIAQGLGRVAAYIAHLTVPQPGRYSVAAAVINQGLGRVAAYITHLTVEASSRLWQLGELYLMALIASTEAF